mmetsp:Transcript_16128/g.26040  ORF Transcript_16128/g.26040 Transcript_16128/m.26040 type:complete len:134 (+) Transcript_16128:20-421(+)
MAAMAAVAAQHVVVVPRASVRRGRLGAAAPASLRPRRGLHTTRVSAQELAQVAIELDSEKITIIVATICGLGAGLGIPIFFVSQENRDKERLDEIRDLNRATLKATGEQMSEQEIDDLRPSRYLDRREFKDDD